MYIFKYFLKDIICIYFPVCLRLLCLSRTDIKALLFFCFILLKYLTKNKELQNDFVKRTNPLCILLNIFVAHSKKHWTAAQVFFKDIICIYFHACLRLSCLSRADIKA